VRNRFVFEPLNRSLQLPHLGTISLRSPGQAAKFSNLLGPVVPIEAGVSTLLVLSLGAEMAGLARMLDVLIGAVVGLVFNRLLLLWPGRPATDQPP